MLVSLAAGWKTATLAHLSLSAPAVETFPTSITPRSRPGYGGSAGVLRDEGAPQCQPGQQMGTHMLVLSLVLIGLAITLEPIPLTAFILILAAEGGVRK